MRTSAWGGARARSSAGADRETPALVARAIRDDARCATRQAVPGAEPDPLPVDEVVHLVGVDARDVHDVITLFHLGGEG